MKTFALALGGGGARGLAHIAVIEALDDMGIKPAAVAGTSIGALVGASYAAGMRGREIRHHVIKFAHDRAESRRRILRARAGKLSDMMSSGLSRATQMDARKFCEEFLPERVPDDFSALVIPLTVVATDLHRREETSFSSGALRQALAASVAFPGLFRPVGVGDRILVDGAATNPLPFDLLAGVADLIVAVDIFGASAATRSDTPGVWESLTTTLNIMGSTIAAAKQKHVAPDLVIRPNVATFSTLDFYQASAILRAAEPAKGDVKQKLGALLA